MISVRESRGTRVGAVAHIDPADRGDYHSSMPFLLMRNSIQHYAWGSVDAFPRLLGMENADGTPLAELWMGAHPDGPSLVRQEGRWVTLAGAIEDDPEGMLGREVVRKLGSELPFLLKLLAAEKALSIQAHPSREQAEAGFEREERYGVSLDSPLRNYKDRNHKPEILCAVEPFWGMCGFRQRAEIEREFDAPELRGPAGRALRAALESVAEESAAQAAFLRALLSLSADRVDEVVRGALALAERRLADVKQSAPADCRSAAVQRCWWVTELGRQFAGDVGVLAPLFLRLVFLEPGDALFISSDTLHAYLHGCGIELMANSNNVLRGGLTPKRIDVPELLRIIESGTEEHAAESARAAAERSASGGADSGRGDDTPGPIIYRCSDSRPAGVLDAGESACSVQPERISARDGSIAGRLWRYPVPVPDFTLERLVLEGNLPLERRRGEKPEIVFCLAGRIDIRHGDERVTVPRGQSVFIPARQLHYTLAGEGEVFVASVGDRVAD